jgi:uncharacterized protein (TIGR02145 family)
MKKNFTLILGMAFVFGCSTNNNSNIDNSPSSYSYSQGVNITDIDGNTYPTIVTNCSNQTWMQKNLNVSHYRNGDVIPQVTDPIQWANLTTGAWCYYNNDPANGTIYGKLYNWYAVNDPRGLAPSGYHIPSDSEWISLTTCLGGVGFASSKMKEIGTLHWLNPNTDATNLSGFTALPAGIRGSYDGAFSQIKRETIWWSSTQETSIEAWTRGIYYASGTAVSRNNMIKEFGLSVRCIKD